METLQVDHTSEVIINTISLSPRKVCITCCKTILECSENVHDETWWSHVHSMCTTVIKKNLDSIHYTATLIWFESICINWEPPIFWVINWGPYPPSCIDWSHCETCCGVHSNTLAASLIVWNTSANPCQINISNEMKI